MFVLVFMHSMLLFNKMTKCFELPNVHYKFHIINISCIIVSGLKHQADLDISVQFVMLQ